MARTNLAIKRRRQNEKRARARAAVEQLLGGACHRCGGRGPFHVWRTGVSDRGGITPWLVCRLDRYVRQIEGAELLCGGCHRVRLREHAKDVARLRRLARTELSVWKWRLAVEALDLVA